MSLYEEESFDHLEEDVSSEVKIVEISRNIGEEVTLYNAQVRLLTDEETSIVLSDPILIRYGFTYQVRMKQSPPKPEIKPKSDITIGFKNDSVAEGDNRGLILSMEINSL